MANSRGKDGMYITYPGFGRSFHIFDKEDRSLCGKAAMLRVDPAQATPLTGKETYERGKDCKPCFRKAGLAIPTEESLPSGYK